MILTTSTAVFSRRFRMKKMLTVIVCAVFQMAFATQTYFVGIAGGTASGKTTFAKKLHELFPEDSLLIYQDSYYRDVSHLPLETRLKINFDHPDSINFALLEEQLIELKNGGSVIIPEYSFISQGSSKIGLPQGPSKIVIVEGILLFAVPEVRDLFDLKIYIDTEDDVRVLRRLFRDVQDRGLTFEQVERQYLETVKPMHDFFVEPSKQYADIIVPEGGHNTIALELVAAKLKEML